MAVPTSATTDAELWQTYDDAASYDVVGSTSLAKEFIVACRLILRRRPSRMAVDGQSADFESIREDLTRAERWYAVSQSGSGRRYLDFRGLRD